MQLKFLQLPYIDVMYTNWQENIPSSPILFYKKNF